MRINLLSRAAESLYRCYIEPRAVVKLKFPREFIEQAKNLMISHYKEKSR